MGIALKFVGGILMTLAYVVVVPYVTDTYITPYIIEFVGDNSFLFIGTETLIQILMFLVLIAFILLLGGGAVLRWCGVFGVLGMIVAYWLLGDVTKATIPVISLIIVYFLLLPFKIGKKAKEDRKELKKKIKEKRKEYKSNH